VIAVIGVLGSKMLQDCTTCIAIPDPTANIGCAAESGAAEAISQHLLFWSEEGSVVDGSVAKVLSSIKSSVTSLVSHVGRVPRLKRPFAVPLSGSGAQSVNESPQHNDI
jgi:hypothetical protein